MFLDLGHLLAKGETCGDGRLGNARYMNANKTEVDYQLIAPDDVYIDFPLHGQSAIAHLRENLRSRVSEIPQTCLWYGNIYRPH